MRPVCDYHNHPQAHSPQAYTLELLQPWAEAARRHGLVSLALTDHDRYHAGVDFDVVDRFRERNPDLQICIGIELDNDPETSGRGRAWVERHWDRLDFVLGSVHYLPGAGAMFDRADQAAQVSGRDGPERAYAGYLAELETLIRRGAIDALSHLDLIKIHGLFPAGYDPAERFRPVLESAATAGLAVEASTAGWRKPVGEQYPHEAILGLARNLQLNVTTASDAHAPAQLAADFGRLGAMLTVAGVTRLVRFQRHTAELV